MKTFDFEQYRVIGYVEDKLGDNATIDVIGYCGDNIYNYFTLSKSDAFELFPSRGKVFAYRFSLYNKNLRGKIVCICVQPSNNDGSENYVWDWNGDVIEYGRSIKSIKGIFSDDGQHNYDILRNNGLLEGDEEKLVRCSDRIYQILPNNNEGNIKYWEISSINTITIDDKLFFVGITLPKHDGVIDVTSDNQLVNWYLTKIVKKNWAIITQNKSFRNIESFLFDILTSNKEVDEVIITNRLKKLKTINTNLSITFESLKEIADTPWFGESVRLSMEEHKEQLLKQLIDDKATEIKRIEEDFALELLRLEEEQNNKIISFRKKIEKEKLELEEKVKNIEAIIKEKNIEIELLEEANEEKQQILASLENTIEHLSKRKDAIIQDFSIIREVLNQSHLINKQQTNKLVKNFSIEEINYSEKPVVRFQAYVKALENIFKSNDVKQSSPSNIAKLLATYNVLLCPSYSVAQSLIMASHKCMYLTEYVSAKWTSFDNLWDNGLEYMVNQSMNNSDIMHFLLLQNINISYLPNFMQPLVDIQKGIITKFPTTCVPFPKNLRILCTVINEDELIPMPKSVIRYFGCIDKSSYFETDCQMLFADDSHLGYLTPNELYNQREVTTDAKNMFEQYIDE